MNKKTPDFQVIRGGKADEPPAETRTKQFDIGSDVEIARRVVDDLSGSFDRVVHAEGAFWRYGGSHWE
jgi:hypothetical protein